MLMRLLAPLLVASTLALFGTGIALAELGQTEIRFAWAAGTSVVIVNVVGADLTAAEAQRVAALAGPSS
jgi:hypothetical protein